MSVSTATPKASPGRPPAVFLDRDETLIHNTGDLGDPSKVELVQGAAMAVASLRGLGFQVVVVTNQGGVARGKYGEADVEAVHARIDALLERGANGATIAGYYFCPYHPKGTEEEYIREHPDRKPAPGMMLRAAEDLKLDLARSWMVGDALRDTQAGEAAGCRTVLLHPEAGRLSPTRLEELAREQAKRNSDGDEASEAAAEAHRPDFFAGTLVEAVRVIASQRHTERNRVAAGPVVTTSPSPSATPPPSASTPAANPKRAPGRAFRPLSLPPEEETGPLAEAPVSAIIDRGRPVVERAMQRARGRQDTEKPAEPATPPAPTVEAPPAPAAPATRAAESADRRPLAPEPPAVRGEAEPADGSSKVLQQILHELRGNRSGGGGDASAATIVALVLQALTLVCLLGALWMAAGDDSLFQRWALATLVFQGGTIAALLVARR